MLKIGTKVYHSGHGHGTIIGYNGSKQILNDVKDLGLITTAVGLGLGEAVVNSFYSGDAFPYIVQFDNGYKDVYSDYDVKEVVAA